MAAKGDGSKAKEIKKLTDECPWCLFDNKDERVAPVHKAFKGSVLVQTNFGTYQCNECGKHWEPTALGKDWSIELERGAAWEREHKARQLTGR